MGFKRRVSGTSRASRGGRRQKESKVGKAGVFGTTSDKLVLYSCLSGANHDDRIHSEAKQSNGPPSPSP